MTEQEVYQLAIHLDVARKAVNAYRSFYDPGELETAETALDLAASIVPDDVYARASQE